MTKLIKILIGIIVSLIVVVIAAAVLIPILVDPNDYKDEITQQVYNQTGRTLTIEGDINLSVSLPLSVSLELGKLELSNAEGFADKPFARMQSASLYVAIMPLLSANRLDVGEIKLAGMELNLIKNKQGKTNWADLSGAQKAPAEGKKTGSAKKEPTANKEPSANKELPAISVAGVNISDAVINWTDEQAGQSISLSKTNISISELIEDKPFELSITTHINSTQPAIKGNFSLSSSPTISLSKQLFQLPATELSVDLSGDALPGGANKTKLSGDIIFNGKSRQLDIKKMQLSTYEMVINGLFHAEQLDSAAQFNGQISIEPFSPKKLAAVLGASLPEMKQDKALTSADAEITFKGNQQSVTISSLQANLDDTSLKGTASIKNFSKPLYGFDLALNQLNLDYYALAEQAGSVTEKAPAATKKTPAKKKASATKNTSTAPLFPVDTLRQLNLDGQLAIAQFIAGKAKMTNVLIVLKGKNGLVQLAPLKADLYKGTINLKTDIDVRGKTPKLKIINDLKNVQIGDLLLETTGSQEFTGTANISANITTSGNDQNHLLKNSNGTVKLLVTDGHIKKLDVISTLRKAQALYRGTKAPTEDQDKNTKFTELKATLAIKNGVIHNNDLTSKSPIISVTGKGYADLPKEYMDYTLMVTLLDSLKIDKKSQGADLSSKSIPYTIKGKFSELSETADVSKVLGDEVKRRAQKELDKQLDKHKDKLGKELGDKLKGFLKF